MKILFLLPPSEGKNSGGNIVQEKLEYTFQKPLKIANNATEKDLKCTGKRYSEAIDLNKSIERTSEFLPAIQRYSGVMYNAISYNGMTTVGQDFFDNNFAVLSGMYGIVMPQDSIANYKLPIETKGLYNFWGSTVSKYLNIQKYDYIVNLLPGAYAKMIQFNDVGSQIVHVHFLTEKNGKISKMTHGVKKVKGEWVKNICENAVSDYNEFGGEICKREDGGIDVNITI